MNNQKLLHPVKLCVPKYGTKIQHNQLTATVSNPTNGNDENIDLGMMNISLP